MKSHVKELGKAIVESGENVQKWSLHFACTFQWSTGVLLLNACLTVRAREANSHAGKVCTIIQYQLLWYTYQCVTAGLGKPDGCSNPLAK